MFSIWWHAARPKTLMASICPVVIGTALASRDGQFHAGAALAALLGAIAIQVGTNYANDYFDARQGADTDARKGPRRAVQAGLVAPAAMLRATVIAFTIAAIFCAYLVSRAGWTLAAIGILSLISGVGYTASRFSLAYLGLGDLFVLFFFGPIAVAGTYFVQALQWSPASILAGFAPGFVSVGILVVNNLRDIQEDAQAQKRTLAVRYGATFARLEYLACMLLAACIPVGLWLLTGWPVQVLWSSLPLLLGLVLSRQLWNTEGVALNPYLGKTAAVLMLFTLVFSGYCLWS